MRRKEGRLRVKIKGTRLKRWKENQLKGKKDYIKAIEFKPLYHNTKISAKQIMVIEYRESTLVHHN